MQGGWLVWPQNRDGNYSVKTGYQLLGELENREVASGSSSKDLRNFWSNCGKASETALHALWDYDKAQCCWGLNFNKLRSQHLVLGSFADLVFLVRQHKENIELFTVLAWFIWCRHNKCHFNEPSLPPKKLLEAVESVLVKFQGKLDSKPERIKAQTQRWSPPTQGTYKVNYDGAYFVEEEEVGIEVVVRNKSRQVMASLAKKIAMPSTVEVFEAMVARRAMIFLEELGLR
nr:hypothetical protein CFP56_60374 [Quercus suber]